jgi:general secretion pathway protein K
MARAALNRARGAAIVLAMLIAALAAAVAVTVFADQQRWSRAVEHRRDQVQAQALVMAGVQWARQILDDDARHSDTDTLREAWAIPLPPIPLDNGEIRGAIVDAQARLNINGLGEKGATADLERQRLATLFAQRGGPTAALDAIADWIDVDTVVRDAGAEDAFYAAQTVPGLPPDAPVVRIAELASVRGVTAPSLDAVAPFLSALPAGTPVNVNTAAPEVLATLVDGLDGDRLAALVADRASKPYASISDFRARLPKGASLASESALSVKSGFFYVTVEARQGETIARARALLSRSAGAPTAIAWQVVE